MLTYVEMHAVTVALAGSSEHIHLNRQVAVVIRDPQWTMLSARTATQLETLMQTHQHRIKVRWANAILQAKISALLKSWALCAGIGRVAATATVSDDRCPDGVLTSVLHCFSAEPVTYRPRQYHHFEQAMAMLLRSIVLACRHWACGKGRGV